MLSLIIWTIISLILIALGFIPGWIGEQFSDIERKIRISLIGFGSFLLLWTIASTSYVIIPQNRVAHLKQIFGNPLPSGRIIAVNGQQGPQARILGPGLTMELFINVINSIDYESELSEIEIVPAKKIGILLAQDGQSLSPGQFIADTWDKGKEDLMLNAEYFLSHGGRKGVQFNVLAPGSYRLNKYLWKVIPGDATPIEPGEVGVIKSNYGKEPDAKMIGKTEIPLVPKGYIGIWNEPLYPGNYYINPQALEVHKISTRLLSWEYKGGFTYYRKLQKEASFVIEPEDHPIPENVADGAIIVRSKDGFDVPFELRIQGQVIPIKAPFVYAVAGDLQKIEDNVLTPVLRSVVRNSGVSHNALDYLEKRSLLEGEIEENIRPEAAKVGFTIQEIRIGEIFIPWELKDTQTRQELAIKLQTTYKQEKLTQDQRKEMEAAKATADKQSVIVTQQIANRNSELKKEEKNNLGTAEANFLTRLAEGQAKQVAVLGEDRVMQLRLMELILDAVVKNPNIVKVPQVNVQSGSSSLEGAAAILGASNLLNALATPKLEEKDKGE